jgi:magnesium transporter
MIQLLSKGHKSLTPVELGELKRDPAALEEAIWIDLLMPSREEEEFVETHLDVEIPTKEEMHEIEASSRLFVEDKALYMSCWMLSYESPIPENTSVTFILSPKHLTSIRYSDHHAFRIFTSQRRTRQPRRFNSTNDALVELMDAVVDQTASTLRQVEQSLNGLSLEIFSEQGSSRGKGRSPGLKEVVQRLGKRNSLVSSLRESSMSFQNLAMFVLSNADGWILPAHIERIRLTERDIRSLRDYDAQLSAEINFLLDSTVGLIGFQQNQSMKILSVAALVLALI